MIVAKCSVEVYDLTYTDSSQYGNLQAQLDHLYPTAAGSDGHVRFQVQQSTDHHGLIAVAIALAVEMGKESQPMVLDVTRMRKHLTQCLRRSSSPWCLFTDLFIYKLTYLLFSFSLDIRRQHIGRYMSR